jgi:hypothetical protein
MMPWKGLFYVKAEDARRTREFPDQEAELLGELGKESKIAKVLKDISRHIPSDGLNGEIVCLPWGVPSQLEIVQSSRVSQPHHVISLSIFVCGNGGL